MHREQPVPIGPGVWWVGSRLPNDQFQCHAYVIENGDESVLLDPGSPLTIDETLLKVAQVVDVDAIKYLVCHHPDPDIAASLRDLSDVLTRTDVKVVTEWRAQALLKHYRHRFGYYRVEENGWTVPLSPGRSLEFQLTPYLHFPGAMVSFDTGSRTLFSSDLFGGFVPDSDVLVSHDLAYIIDSARPFHHHYMPSTELLTAGLGRIQQRWPDIAQIAPQHGHIIPGELVDSAFEALMDIECGVFTLADTDMDLKRLLRISEAKARITEALLTITDPGSLVSAINVILAATHEVHECALFIDVPGQGWTMWKDGLPGPVRRDPEPDVPTVDLLGPPAAVLTIGAGSGAHPSRDLMRMLEEMASTVRPAVDDYLEHRRQSQRTAAYREASLTDPLTGLGNRRALEALAPAGDYALISLDLDHFKEVNDTFGHAAGDAVLVKVAGALTAGVREGDAVFRLGGEEFLILLPDSDQAAAVTIAERVRGIVKALDLDGLAPGGRITISAGVITVVGAGQDDFADQWERADEALYRSKDAGRDTVTVG